MDETMYILKILIPASISIYVAYLIIKLFIRREYQLKKLAIQKQSAASMLPIKLHAYERMTLYLERISPQNLLIRLNKGQMPAKDFQRILLEDIRNEYDHNTTQQLYISETVWDQIKNAKEDLIMVINEAASNLPADANGIDLAKKVFNIFMERKIDVIGHALQQLKEESKQLY